MRSVVTSVIAPLGSLLKRGLTRCGRLKLSDFVFVGFALIFSTGLMWHTFKYEANGLYLKISNHIWSDFLAHLPIIRSFSYGHNWPPEYPFYPGEPMRYHFLFDAIIGGLEKLGLPLDWALNLPSVLSLLSLLIVVYAFAVYLYRDRRVAWLSALLLLFNGSGAFVNFLVKHHDSKNLWFAFWNLAHFPAFGPYDGSEITAFWNLNVFTNQRHLAAALAYVILLCLLTLWLQEKPKRLQSRLGMLFGLGAGLFPFFHQPALFMMALTSFVYLLLVPASRRFLLVFGATTTLVVALQIPFLIKITTGEGSPIIFYPGYQIHNSLSLSHFLSYWIKNLGIHSVLIPLGIFLSPKKVRLAYVPAMLIFIFACLVRFRGEVELNHKFFNFSVIVGQMASAYLLIRLLDAARLSRKRLAGDPQLRTLVPAVLYSIFSVALLASVLSGVLDLAVIKNTGYHSVKDLAGDDVARWIEKNTSPRAVFLNSQFGYSSPSMAGRPILLGWPYFAKSLGYDVTKREKMAKIIFAGNSPQIFCPLLHQLNASFVMIEQNRDANFPDMNVAYFTANFVPEYLSKDGKVSVFSTAQLCLKK